MRFNESPILTVDCVLVRDDEVVLIRRGSEPYEGCLALPGGFVDNGETLESACVREVREETGITLSEADLRLVGVYSDPGRDPRFHTVTVAYTAKFNDVDSLVAGDDAASVHLTSEWRSADIAFDHKKIIEDAKDIGSED